MATLLYRTTSKCQPNWTQIKHQWLNFKGFNSKLFKQRPARFLFQWNVFEKECMTIEWDIFKNFAFKTKNAYKVITLT